MNEVKTLRTAFFVQMDNTILGLDISLSQKVVCGAIDGLSREEGFAYISNESLAKLLYVTPKSIERHISKLVNLGLVKNIGKKYDRKLIFISPLSVKKEHSNPQKGGSNPQKGGSNPQKGGSNPQKGDYAYIILKHNIKDGQKEFDPKDLTLTKKEFYDLTFEYFWKLYPKHVKKQESIKAFEKRNTKEIDALLAALPAIKYYHDKSNHPENAFIPDCPHPPTFINNSRWEDECYLVQKISKKGAAVSVGSEIDGCLRRFRALSDGDDVNLHDVDFAVLGALDMSEEAALEIVNTEGMDVFKADVLGVWTKVTDGAVA